VLELLIYVCMCAYCVIICVNINDINVCVLCDNVVCVCVCVCVRIVCIINVMR
jgi:hypothetical protein